MLKLLLAEFEHPADGPFYAERLRAVAPDLDIVTADTPAAAVALAAGAQILVAKAHSVSPALAAAMPDLRWIQALTTGVDALDSLALAPEIMITSMRGIHGPQMSELAMLLMLALQRQFPRLLRHQATKTWQRWPQPLLAGRTVLLVGLGVIAEMIAVRCAAFDMRITGVSDGRTEAPGFAAVYPRARLAEAAAEADFVIVLVPASDATHNLIDETVLRAMAPHSFLINIARGRVVDEAALIRALNDGWIAGAALDVFAREPLPADYPLWTAPNLIITPHIGGLSDAYADQVLPTLVHNVAAYVEGRLGDMRNRVRSTGNVLSVSTTHDIS